MTSHDVRSLKLCCLCQGFGIHRPKDPTVDVPLVVCLHSEGVASQHRRFAHPRCYLRQMGIAKLLTLAGGEIDSIRLCDVSRTTMQAILKRREATQNGNAKR